MRKIGERLLLWVLLLSPVLASGQNDVKVTAGVNASAISRGDRIAFSIEINGSSFRNVTRPQLPSIPGLLLQSAQPSTSTNYSFVNGVASRSYTLTYVYLADKAGSITIPSVQVTVDGAEYPTNPITLTVREASNEQIEAAQDFFVRMELNAERPVVGQQILAELALYFKAGVEVISYSVSNNWRTDGFWKESLNDGTTPQAETVVINGERYRKAVLSRHALFPNRSGELSVGEQAVSLTVRNASRYQDPFNVFFGNQRTVDVSTRSVPVRVRSLPAPGPEAGTAINAVGDFQVVRRVGNASVGVGEAVELVTEVIGAGNLALVSKPDYELPDGFETFQPSDDLQLTRTPTELSGVRTFRDIVIARRAGQYTIPAATLAVYDPDNGRYRSITLPAITITVTRDAAMAGGSSYVSEQTFAMVPIAAAVSWPKSRDFRILLTWWFWAGILLPLIALVIAKRRKDEQDRLDSDHGYFRRTNAKARADAKLAAITDTEDVKESYSKLYSALSGFIADMLGLPEAGWDDADLLVHLEPHLNPDELASIRKFFDVCTSIRFAPVQSRKDVVREQQTVLALIKRLQEVLP